MKLHLNAFMSCLLGHSKPTFAAIHLYSVFSQIGEDWGGCYRGDTHQVSSGERVLSGTSRQEAVGPDGRIYLLLI